MNIKKKISLLHSEAHGHSRAHVKELENPGDEGGSVDEEVQDEGAAHKLWKQWAAESLGPIHKAPADYMLARKNAHLDGLERKCAALAAMAQRRLETSAAIRQGWGGGNGRKVDLDGWQEADADDHIFKTGLQPGGFPREAAWATHEQRKQAVYNIVRGAGVQERKEGAGQEGSKGDHTQVEAVHQPGSRALLDSMIAAVASKRSSDGSEKQKQRTSDAGEPGRGASYWSPSATSPSNLLAQSNGGRQQPVKPSSKRLFAGGPPLDARLMGILTSHARARPQSAAGSAPKRTLDRPQDGATDGGVTLVRSRCQSAGHVQSRSSSRQAEMVAQYELQLSQMQDRLEEVRGQLEDALTTVQSHSELEVQLRETIDMLRARLHTQGAREQEQQRRLQQHSRLEPLFDRLAENFAFKSPEDVVARLEYLEDEKLSSLDELIRTQEEVTSLQRSLAEAVKRVELTHSTLTTTHINATARLSKANDSLEAEVQELEGVNRRLVDRQKALLSLQGAVIDLWSYCQEDPSCRQAPVDHREGGVGHSDSGALSLANPGDPLNILALVKEFLIAKSPQLASRQYLQLQKVANNVWMQHFHHKAGLHGRVADTFEALSSLADIMAAKIRSMQEQLKNSLQGNKKLEDSLTRLTVQKRALKVSLQRRDSLVRLLSGVPQRERPHSASAYHAMARKDEITNWDTDFRKLTRAHDGKPASLGGAAHITDAAAATKAPCARPRSAHPSCSEANSPASPYAPLNNSANTNRDMSSSMQQKQRSGPSTAQDAPLPSFFPSSYSGSQADQGGRRPARPFSAPSSRRRPPYEPPLPLPPQLLDYPRSSSIMSGYSAPKLSDKPAGGHWDVLTAAASRPASARAGGLFNTAAPTISSLGPPQSLLSNDAPPVAAQAQTPTPPSASSQHPIPQNTATALKAALAHTSAAPESQAHHAATTAEQAGAAAAIPLVSYAQPPSPPHPQRHASPTNASPTSHTNATNTLSPHTNSPTAALSSPTPTLASLEVLHNTCSKAAAYDRSSLRRSAEGGVVEQAPIGGHVSSAMEQPHRYNALHNKGFICPGHRNGDNLNGDDLNGDLEQQQLVIAEDSHADEFKHTTHGSNQQATTFRPPANQVPQSQAAAVQELMKQQRAQEQQLQQELAQPRWQRRGGGSETDAGESSVLQTDGQTHTETAEVLHETAGGQLEGSVRTGALEQRSSNGRSATPKWVAPSRSAIEARFLSRLERGAR